CTGWPVLRWIRSISQKPTATITATTASSTASRTTNTEPPSSTGHRRGLVRGVALALDDGPGVDDHVAVGVDLHREQVQGPRGRPRDELAGGRELGAVAVAGEDAAFQVGLPGHRAAQVGAPPVDGQKPVGVVDQIKLAGVHPGQGPRRVLAVVADVDLAAKGADLAGPEIRGEGAADLGQEEQRRPEEPEPEHVPAGNAFTLG